MRFISFFIGLLCSASAYASSGHEITSFKYEDKPLEEYAPPTSSVHHILRSADDLTDIQYYMSNPNSDEDFPILILASGSSIPVINEVALLS